MRFRDFSVGQVLKLGPVTVDADAIVAFATAYDPQPFHTDIAFAQQSRWQGLIASGWHTCTMAMRLMCDGPLKWPAPVRPGDTLRLEAQVLEASLSKSGRVGILQWRWLLINQTDETVLDLQATSLFDLSRQRE